MSSPARFALLAPACHARHELADGGCGLAKVKEFDSTRASGSKDFSYK